MTIEVIRKNGQREFQVASNSSSSSSSIIPLLPVVIDAVTQNPVFQSLTHTDLPSTKSLEPIVTDPASAVPFLPSAAKKVLREELEASGYTALAHAFYGKPFTNTFSYSRYKKFLGGIMLWW